MGDLGPRIAIAKTDDLSNIVMWIMGSLDEPSIGLIKMAFFGSIAGLVASYFFCFDLNALLLGEEDASNLGVNTARTKKFLFIIILIIIIVYYYKFPHLLQTIF